MQVVTIKGESKFLCAEDCTGMHLAVEMATMAVLVLRCTKCILVIGGIVPSVTLRDCINVEIIIGDCSVLAGIETVGCHGIVVTAVPLGLHQFLTPQQLETSLQKTSGEALPSLHIFCGFLQFCVMLLPAILA